RRRARGARQRRRDAPARSGGPGPDRRRRRSGRPRDPAARADARCGRHVRLEDRRVGPSRAAARRDRPIVRQRLDRDKRPRERRPNRRRRHDQGVSGRDGPSDAADRIGRRLAGRRIAVISNYFIDRPLFATVVSAFIVIAGLAAFRALPVAMYPDITPPQVSVTTVYPGASADVVAETVAAPLEQALNGVEDMLYLRSASSSSGSLEIAITFAVGTDPDIAVINVQNRVQSALQMLPEEVRRQGVTV